MSSFLRGLTHLRAGRDRIVARRRELSPRLLVDDDELGRVFRVGDRVRDVVTGGSGHVERVENRRVILPASRR